MYSSKLLPVLFACALILSLPLYARHHTPVRTGYEIKTIAGTITDAKSSEPLAGVSVMVKGTTQGTTTDIAGKFSIAVPDKGAVLVI